MSDWRSEVRGTLKKRPKRRWWAVAARPFPSGNLMLDQTSIPALAAYSLRRIRGSYGGPAVNIRRSTDNATQDIGFVGNSFDVTSFSNFVGGGTGFVAIWYDQQGGANATAIGGLAANQSPIALAITPSGQPAVNSTATTQGMIAATPASQAVVSFSAVSNRTGNFTNYGLVISFDGNMPGLAWNATAGTGWIVGNANVAITGPAATTDNAFHAAIGVVNGVATQVQTEVGTSATANITGATGSTQIDLVGRSGFGLIGYLAEAIIWNGALASGDITTIFANQRGFYGF